MAADHSHGSLAMSNPLIKVQETRGQETKGQDTRGQDTRKLQETRLKIQVFAGLKSGAM